MLSSSSPDPASLFAGTTELLVVRFVPGTRRRVGFLVGRWPRFDVSLSLSLSSSLESGARLLSDSWSLAVACCFPPTVCNNGAAFLVRKTIILLHLAHVCSRTLLALRRQLVSVPRHDALRSAKPLCAILSHFHQGRRSLAPSWDRSEVKTCSRYCLDCLFLMGPLSCPPSSLCQSSNGYRKNAAKIHQSLHLTGISHQYSPSPFPSISSLIVC